MTARLMPAHRMRPDRCYCGTKLQGKAPVPCLAGKHCMHEEPIASHWIIPVCCRCDWRNVGLVKASPVP